MFVEDLFTEGLFVADLWVDDADGDGTAGDGESAPANLAAVLNGDGTATLTWTDGVTDNTGYAIERKDGAGEFVEIEDDAGDVETYEDTGPLDPETEYTYRVKVLGGALDGEFSNEAGASEEEEGGVDLIIYPGMVPYSSRRSTRPKVVRPLIRPRRLK